MLTLTEPAERRVEVPSRDPTQRRLSGVTLSVVASLIVVIAAAAGYAFVDARPETYAARAELAYDVSRANSSAALQQQMQTAAVIVNSRAVLNQVAEWHGLEPDELEASTSVDVVGQSGIIAVTVKRPSSSEAVAIAQSVADEGLSVLGGSDPNPRQSILESALQELRAEVDELTVVLDSPDATSAAKIAAGLRYEQIVLQIANLESRLVDLQLERAGFQGTRVLAPAYELGPVSMNPLSGLAAGLLLGMFLAATMTAVVWQLRAHRHRP